VTRQMIEQLHRIYCDETRLQVSCSLHRHMAWDYWQQRGFTEKDLRDVCRYMRKAVDRGRHSIGCLSFHLLIADPDYFEEKLAEVRSFERKPKFNPGKADVLKATGRPSEPAQSPAKPVLDVMKGLKIADALRKFRDKL
jgi:hypothetical protein